MSGGKTGTAQAVGLKAGEKYSSIKADERKRDHSLYVAFAPMEQPTVALAVIVENAGWGAGAAASLVYGREQLHSRNDPWLQMLALQASGYGRDEEEAEQRRRARGHCDTPGCPYAGRAPCEQPFWDLMMA